MPNISTVRAVVNGQTYDLTLNSSTGKYEAVITAPSKSSYPNDGHYYDVALTANDNAGNSVTIDSTHETFGSALQLVVKEKVAPVISIASPSNGSTITSSVPTITVNVTDNDSGVDVDTFTLKVGSTTVTAADCTVSDITNGKRFAYTPKTALADGECVITANVSDNDGNAAAAVSSTITIDTTPPVLDISAPADNIWQNTNKVTVVGVTNDATSSPVTVAIKVNGTDAGAVTVDSNGNFTKEVTLSEGENAIVITATDAAGKASTVTRTVNVNTTLPEFKSVTIIPNPVDAGKTYTITVEVE